MKSYTLFCMSCLLIILGATKSVICQNLDTDYDSNGSQALDVTSAAVISGDQAVSIAEKYLNENKDEWQFGDTTISLELFNTTGGGGKTGRHKLVMFKQYYDSIPVAGGGFDVKISNRGEVLGINNYLVAGIKVDTSTMISAEEAERILLENCPDLKTDQIQSTWRELMIMPAFRDYDTGLYWSFTLQMKTYGQYCMAYVNAQTGELRECRIRVDR